MCFSFFHYRILKTVPLLLWRIRISNNMIRTEIDSIRWKNTENGCEKQRKVNWLNRQNLLLWSNWKVTFSFKWITLVIYQILFVVTLIQVSLTYLQNLSPIGQTVCLWQLSLLVHHGFFSRFLQYFNQNVVRNCVFLVKFVAINWIKSIQKPCGKYYSLNQGFLN